MYIRFSKSSQLPVPIYHPYTFFPPTYLTILFHIKSVLWQFVRSLPSILRFPMLNTTTVLSILINRWFVVSSSTVFCLRYSLYSVLSVFVFILSYEIMEERRFLSSWSVFSFLYFIDLFYSIFHLECPFIF